MCYVDCEEWLADKGQGRACSIAYQIYMYKKMPSAALSGGCKKPCGGSIGGYPLPPLAGLGNMQHTSVIHHDNVRV